MKRSYSQGSQALLTILVFGAILVMLYLVVMKHPMTWDISQGKQNRLDQKTTNILKGLKTDVDIKVFEKAGSASAAGAKDMLQRYALLSRHVTFTIIDPDTHPDQAKSLGVEQYGQAVLVSGAKKEYIDSVDEQQLSTALIKLGQTRSKVIYCIEGHGEKRISEAGKNGTSALREALSKDNYRVDSLVLMRGPIPADADCLAIIGPDKPLLPGEIQALQGYLDRGGRLFLALEPMKDAGLEGLLGGYGVKLGDDFIIDPTSRVLGADYSMPVVMTYGAVPALANFSLVTFFPTARSLEIAKTQPQGITIDWLAQTSEQSWSEFDSATWNREGQAKMDVGDRKGPRIVALEAKKNLGKQRSSELLVFGDSDFLTNTYLGLSGNKDLALNCLNMLLGENVLITITKRPSTFKPFVLTPRQGALVFWIPVVLMPAVLLLAGVMVFLWRRKA